MERYDLFRNVLACLKNVSGYYEEKGFSDQYLRLIEAVELAGEVLHLKSRTVGELDTTIIIAIMDNGYLACPITIKKYGDGKRDISVWNPAFYNKSGERNEAMFLADKVRVMAELLLTLEKTEIEKALAYEDIELSELDKAMIKAAFLKH